MNNESVYRKLFFIQLLHGFFLDSNESRYFSLTNDKINERLRSTVVDGQYTLMDDLIIQPTEKTNAILRGHRLIYRLLPNGLLLGAMIQEETIDGVTKVKPVVPLDTKLRLQFYIICRNSFRIYSSGRLDPVIPTIYYFTNDNQSESIKYPSLSVPVKNFIDKRFYQMGETAIVNGSLQEAILPTRDALVGWNNLDLNGINYVSEYDRILIKKKFIYHFDAKGIQEATFELKKENQSVKTISVSNQGVLSDVPLNFELKDDQKTPIEDGVYKLKVTATDDYTWESDLYLNDHLYNANCWGILDIAMYTSDPQFSILDQDGSLTGADKFSFPMMELRMLNRSTYWKYYFQLKGPADGDNNWEPSSMPTPPGVGKVIVSKKPLPLMKALQKVKYASDFLPNPVEHKLGKEVDGNKRIKICSEILLTKIKL